jgi:hypothetical protein
MHRLMIAALAVLAAGGCSRAPSEDDAADAAALANYSPPFVMSRLDFGGVVERRFRRLDTNADDKLQRSDLPVRMADRLMKFDTNGDGEISNEEWSKGMLARFDAQDLNHDGTVTSDEREAARARQDADLPTPADEPANGAAAARAAK